MTCASKTIQMKVIKSRSIHLEFDRCTIPRGAIRDSTEKKKYKVAKCLGE